MIGLVVLAVGVTLTVAGLIVVFGAWAAVAAGVAVAAAGLLVDWEGLNGQRS